MKTRQLVILGPVLWLLSASATTEAPSTGPGASKATAIEVCRPEGQRAYIERLACANGAILGYRRIGSFGPRAETGSADTALTREEIQKRLSNLYAPLEPGKLDDHVVDQYELSCGAATYRVFMDMYHCPQPAPQSAPQGMVVRSTARAADGCAETPTVVVRRLADKVVAARSLMVLAPQNQHAALAGAGLAWSAAAVGDAVATQLKEAGNDSFTASLTPQQPDPRKEIAARHAASGLTHALLVISTPEPGAAQDWSMRGLWVEASTQQPQFEVLFVDARNCPTASSRATQAMLGALRASGVVK